VQVTHYNPPPL